MVQLQNSYLIAHYPQNDERKPKNIERLPSYNENWLPSIHNHNQRNGNEEHEQKKDKSNYNNMKISPEKDNTYTTSKENKFDGV